MDILIDNLCEKIGLFSDFLYNKGLEKLSSMIYKLEEKIRKFYVYKLMKR